MAVTSRGSITNIASYTGTAANISLDLGCIPAWAIGIDLSVGTSQWFWTNGMNDLSIFGQTNTAGTLATISAGTGGISALDGSAGLGIGLTIGTNTTINLSAHTYQVMYAESH